MLRTRLVALIAIPVIIVAGLGVRAAGGAFAKEAGDALYAVLVYALVVAIFPRWRPITLAGTAVAFCWLVETFQLTGIPAQMASDSRLSRLVLGTTFHAPDLVLYAVGVAVAGCLHWVVRARRPSTRGGA